MEGTTTGGRIHAMGFGGDLRRQFRFLWRSRRPALLFVALLAILVLAGDPWTDDAKMRLLTVWPVWLVFIGPVWAFAVFHNEGPSKRYYFWSQPTGRSAHSLARIVAGLAWLWVIFAALVLAGWVIGLMDGDAWQMAEVGVAGWVNFLSGPLIGYLAVSILTLPSDYPLRWFFGIIFVIPLVVSLFVDWLNVGSSDGGVSSAFGTAVRTLLEPLGNEDWGLGVTMIGGLGKAVAQLEHTLSVMHDPTYAGSTNFDAAAQWWTATPLWSLFFAAIVVFIATRHPDTLPKWRGFSR
jgi:hypothetical protein